MSIDTPRQNTGQLSKQAVEAAREYLNYNNVSQHDVIRLADIIERHTRTVELREACRKALTCMSLPDCVRQVVKEALAAPERTEPHAS